MWCTVAEEVSETQRRVYGLRRDHHDQGELIILIRYQVHAYSSTSVRMTHPVAKNCRTKCVLTDELQINVAVMLDPRNVRVVLYTVSKLNLLTRETVGLKGQRSMSCTRPIHLLTTLTGRCRNFRLDGQ